MTKKERKLLIIDLCARLPYGVRISIDGLPNPIDLYSIAEEDRLFYINGYYSIYEIIKPYLRPMSSMTEKEKKAFNKFICIDEDAWLEKENGCVNQAKIMSGGVDWLNSHHFDYRGLIAKGLAIEAPKDMYKEEEE